MTVILVIPIYSDKVFWIVIIKFVFVWSYSVEIKYIYSSAVPPYRPPAYNNFIESVPSVTVPEGPFKVIMKFNDVKVVVESNKYT
jgi:hypothetical protein